MSERKRLSRRAFVKYVVGGVIVAAAGGTLAYYYSLQLSPQDKVIEAARQEGKILVYTHFSELLSQRIKGAFESRYPFIQIELISGPGIRMAERFVTEFEKGEKSVDVLTLGQPVLKTILPKGELLAKYVPKDTGWVPADQKDSDGRWTSHGSQIRSIAYNSKLLSKDEAPKSYLDLTDQKWRGNIAFVDFKRFPGAVEFLRAWEKQYGEDFIRQLGRQNIIFPAVGAFEVLRKVAAGEFAVMGPNASLVEVEALKKAGEPVDWVRTNDNTYFTQYEWTGVAANAPHPNAARLFVDFLFSKDGQQILADAGGLQMIPSIRYANPDMSPQGKKLITVEPLSDAELKAYRDKYNRIFS